MQKHWIYKDILQKNTREYCSTLGISPLLAKILLSRGISEPQHVESYLNPSMEQLHDPFLLKDMEKAADRIITALRRRERIVIYGDYDVDGITSTSVMYNFLTGQGGCVDYYIPDRMDEGYGLSKGAVDNILEKGADLIITVDCGITAVEEVEYINGKGAEIIVTDHHSCKDLLPAAYAVINPCRPDSTYPFRGLAGVGVAYKLVQALCRKLQLKGEEEYLDLVSLGTVADVVPLIDENRVLVRYGLEKLKYTGNPGLKALLESSGMKDRQVSSWTVSYVMAPRINAAGRLGDAGRGVVLFTTGDTAKASKIVLELEDENRVRQETEQEILQQALEIISSTCDLSTERVIVAAGENWHHGVIGIVASRITEKYYRPCILLSMDDKGIAKGSGRSIEGLNLFQALSFCSRHLEKYGGHELAAGLTLKSDKIAEFRKDINRYADTVMDETQLQPRIGIDAEITKEDVSIENIRDMEKMAPFGAGNPSPVFAYYGLQINDVRTVGENKHLKLKLNDGNTEFDAIWFNMGSMADSIKRSDRIDVACSLEINIWNSLEKAQINLKDIRLNKDCDLEKAFFDSLELCLDSMWEYKNRHAGLEAGSKKDCGDIAELITVSAKKGTKTLLLVNTLEETRNLVKTLSKLSPEVKKCCKICYTDFDELWNSAIQILVNPHPGKIELINAELVVFCGQWADSAYLAGLADKVANSDIYFYNNKDGDFSAVGEYIPDRQDIAFIYKYLKILDKSNTACDLFEMAKNISKLSGKPFNYFKLKKSMEVLQELELISFECVEGSPVNIRFKQGIKVKCSLEDSELYRKLQLLGPRKTSAS